MSDTTVRTPPARPCPICGKPALPAHRPFCSQRCADVDLQRWLSGAYAVPAEEELPDDGSDPDGPPPPRA